MDDQQKLFVAPDFATSSILQCVSTANIAGVKLSASTPTKTLPLSVDVGMETTNGDMLLGPNPISIFLALNGGSKTSSLAADNLRVDEWLEKLAAGVTSHAAHLYSAFLKDKNIFPLTESSNQALCTSHKIVLEFVKVLEASLKENAKGAGNALVGSDVTLADIAVVSSLWALVDSKILDVSTNPMISGYIEHVAKRKEFVAAIKQLPSFEKAAAAAKKSNAAAASKSSAPAKSVKPMQIDLTDIGNDFTCSMLGTLRGLFTTAMHTAFPVTAELGIEEAAVDVNTNARMKHNYQCNASMAIFGRLKSVAGALPDDCKNPRAVALRLIDAANSVPGSDALLSKLEPSGPGFINIYVNPTYLARRAASIVRDGPQPPKGKKHHVSIDYSSPNIAKDMHVGHLRSTIIGDAVARILEYCGHEVTRFNHVGDWGTQFGMLIAHLKDNFPDVASNPPDITDLTALYKAAKKRFDNEEGFKAAAHREVVALQSGDETNTKLWKSLCNVSEEMLMSVYRRLGVHSDLKFVGESFYNSRIPPVIDECEQKGLISDSDGARVLHVPNSEVPLMVQKRDGGFGYDSTDLAAIKYRIFEKKSDWLIYVVDAGQSLHFELVFKAAKMAGWYDPAKVRIDHTPFGVVQGEDKKKFKTRSGDTVRLVSLLDEARDRMYEHLKSRVEEGSSQLTEDELRQTAERLGYGGVKYFDLRQNRLSDYVFNYDRMLSPDGDTAVYMQYAHARMQSVMRRLADENIDVDGLLKEAVADPDKFMKFDHPSEAALAEQLCKWGDVLDAFQRELMPHFLTGFMYELAGKFSDFYRDCRLLGSEQSILISRLVLVKATVQMIATAMKLLGIEPVDKL